MRDKSDQGARHFEKEAGGCVLVIRGTFYAPYRMNDLKGKESDWVLKGDSGYCLFL